MKEMKTLSINGSQYEVVDDFARENAKPLVVSALTTEDIENYKTDSVTGDKVMEALLSGRQVLVRVPNSDGKDFTAIYVPVLMWQVPNRNDNNYLYVFYLTDEKQNLDLSAMGIEQFQIPVYGELKFLLSRTYETTPLG